MSLSPPCHSLYIEGAMMAKETSHCQNSNNAGTVAECTLGKRGCSNSLLASWLAEFLMRKGQLVHCLDGDPLNRSLSQYRSLGVEKLELAEEVVERDRYDALVEHLTSKGGIFGFLQVIDSTWRQRYAMGTGRGGAR